VSTRAGLESALACSLAIDRRVALRGAASRAKLPGGWVIRHPELAAVYHLNMVILTGTLRPGMTSVDLVTLAGGALAGLEHRFVRVEDAPGAERLAPDLERAGWVTERTQLMVLSDGLGSLDLDARARPVSEAELAAAQLVNFEQTNAGGGIPGLPQLLAAGQRALRAGTPSQGFGAGEEGGVQSTCTLFMDDDVDGVRVAMIDEVSTLPAYRERGLAKAAVTAATAAARDWGAELVMIPADAADWPQVIYSKLGYETVGHHLTFTLLPSPASPPAT
jgi:GNAT superfamily N-acetyltransferase